LGQLFDLDYDLLLYDVTSTYFEGAAAANPQAQRGYSRDHRPDCKQVNIALVVSRSGLPLGYEVFAGNRSDVTTVKEIVEAMESKYGQANRIWVMDRGMVSADNVEFLQQGGRRYILGTPKSMLRKFEQQLLASDWREVHEGLEVKLCPAPGGEEVFILCRSAQRQLKEQAMHDRFERRIEQKLQAMAEGCGKRKQDPLKVAQQVGRLLGKNSRAAGLFQVDVEADTKGWAHLRWTKRDERRDWMKLSEGCYLLRSNVTDWSGEELWRAYIQLTEAEEAFRLHKSDLVMRPVWHQKEHRVQAQHPRLLSCLCSLENSGHVVPTCRPRRRTSQDLRRTSTDLPGRCRAAHTRRRLDPQALCQPPHRPSSNPASTPRPANPYPHRICRLVVKTSTYPH
jgi:transposase